MGEVSRRLNAEGHGIEAIPGRCRRAREADRAHRRRHDLEQRRAPSRSDALWSGEGQDVDALIDAKGLRQMSDAGALERIVDEVLAANPKSVEEFRAGKEKAFNALVGQAMKATRGKANPAQLNELLKRKLAG